MHNLPGAMQNLNMLFASSSNYLDDFVSSATPVTTISQNKIQMINILMKSVTSCCQNVQ